MEEIVTCNICAEQFDSLHLIPKVLECGHTFCSPCLTKLFKKRSSCPNCRAELKGTESSLPINYNTLKVAEIYNSKKCSEEEIVTSIEIMKNECMRRKDIISEKMTSSLEILDKCLKKLKELTVSESQRIDAVYAKKVLNEVGEELKETVDVRRYFDIKSSVSFLLSSYEDSEKFLTEIYKRVENEENVFAVHKIGDDVKYGKISVYENKLFFYSLSRSEVPKESSLIWFDELKQCVNFDNFFTFMKICCNEKNMTRILIIKMFDTSLSNVFIKLCTGEDGCSYKDTPFEKGEEEEDFKDILIVQNNIESGYQSSSEINYNFFNENKMFKCQPNQVYLYMGGTESSFDIFLAKKKYESSPMIGRIISPTNLCDCICYDNPSFLKILDCGILLQL